MIGRIRGTLLVKQPPVLLVDVQGVGYEIEAPMSTFYDLPAPGQEVVLHTHLAVREDAHVLYGFATEGERGLFRQLIKVSGVGARLALALLSGMESAEFARCVADNDVKALTRLPGIGKKTAERLIIELRDKLGTGGAPAALPGEAAVSAAPARPDEEAVSALVALGYKAGEASQMVRAVAAEGLSSEEIIRQALQAVARRRT